VGGDGSIQVKFKAFSLEILSNRYSGDFSSAVRRFTLRFEANIGVVKQIEYLSLFVAFPANDKGKLVLD